MKRLRYLSIVAALGIASLGAAQARATNPAIRATDNAALVTIANAAQGAGSDIACTGKAGAKQALPA